MSLYITIILLIFSYNQITCVTFNGPCPTLPEEIISESNASCSDITKNRVNYVVFGNLPVNNLVSIFGHNWPIRCIFFEFNCFDGKETQILMKEQCSGYSTLDPSFDEYRKSAFTHYTSSRCSGFASSMSCLPVVYDSQIRDKPNQLQSYGMINPLMCASQIGNFTIYTFLRDRYLVIYGCMERPKTDQHEEGAWILVRQGAVATFPDAFYDTFVDKVLEELPGVSATKTNFETVNFREAYNCTCDVCTITSHCPASNTQLDEEYMDDYVDFSMSDYYDYVYDDEEGSGYDEINETTTAAMVTKEDGEVTDGTTTEEVTSVAIDIDSSTIIGTEVTDTQPMTTSGESETTITDIKSSVETTVEESVTSGSVVTETSVSDETPQPDSSNTVVIDTTNAVDSTTVTATVTEEVESTTVIDQSLSPSSEVEVTTIAQDISQTTVMATTPNGSEEETVTDY